MRQLEDNPVTILGRKFDVFGYSDDAWYQEVKRAGSFHEFNLEYLQYLVAPDDICLDLGANIGMITLALSALVPNGHVYAFEGSPETTQALKETLRANKITNASAENTVVGRTAERVKFFDIPDMRSSGHYVPESNTREIAPISQGGDSQIVVSETKSVDQIVRELGLQRLDFMKIDVEGAELDVLSGAAETFRKFSPLVVMEFNSYAFVHLREIAPREALRQMFDCFDEIYYFKNRTGELVQLENSAKAREQFLHDNLFHGFVDDLLCAFKETRMVRLGAMKQQLAIAQKDVEIRRLKEIVAQKEAALDNVLRSPSWRVTAPLRRLKAWMR
jgi:FkbM family methyltransferase